MFGGDGLDREQRNSKARGAGRRGGGKTHKEG